mmetsp:Transcript_807/g.1886  ORF Transcript_807/g.1886 Transcript_807/m.1886 type:complete len:116 (-) Transcript_807:49-396(-)|eukprot:jgi/Tetstr1/434013/TSEL_002447.t1
MAGLIGDAFASVLAAFNSVSWFNVNQSLVFAKWCRDTAGQLVEHAAGARGYTSGEEAEGQGPRAECVCGRKLPPPEGSAQVQSDTVEALTAKLEGMERRLTCRIDDVEQELRSRL